MIPFFILWFGFSWTGKLYLVALGTFLIVVVGVIEAIDDLDPVYLRLILSFGGATKEFLRQVALPGILPAMLAPLRIGLAVAVTLAVVSEFMGATAGLGYVMNVSLSTFSSHTILLCIIVLGLMGGGFDLLLRFIHSKTVPWAKSAAEAVVSRSLHTKS